MLPEAIQYLLRTYATAAAMREALESLRNIRQTSTEAEEDYRKRLNDAIFRCGNIHEEDEKMTYYVDGLNNTIRMVVAQYRENVPRRDLTFEGLCHFARSEDDAHRARMEQIVKVMATAPTKSRGLPRPTSTFLIQDKPRTERTPRTNVHPMDMESQQPLATPKVEEDETLDQEEVQEEEFHYTGRRR